MGMKKIPSGAKGAFYMIESYLRQGGTPNTPIVDRFCREFEIDKGKLIKCIQNEAEWNGLKLLLQRKGLL